MASDDIDLTRGDPDRGDAASERRRRRRQSTASAKEQEASGQSFTEKEVREQLGRAFDGLAKGREARNDTELAEAIREEGDAMTEGFVALTNNVTPLRFPLVVALNLIIVIGAFGHVGGILWGRFTAWRAARQAAYEQETSQQNGVTIIEE